jgi:hypothetical protein
LHNESARKPPTPNRLMKYTTLSDDEMQSRRTIADALEVLRQAAGFQEADYAKVEIGLLTPPSGETTGLVILLFEVASEDITYVVSLPASARFRAVGDTGSKEDFEISRLDGAIVSARGSVRLTDGTELRAVEVVPSYMPIEPSELDWRVVQYTVALVGAEKRCYRSLREGAAPELQPMIPDLRYLDCSSLSGLDLPPLKVISGCIREKDRSLRKISEQKVADALRTFGMRVPKARPRTGHAKLSPFIDLDGDC